MFVFLLIKMNVFAVVIRFLMMVNIYLLVSSCCHSVSQFFGVFVSPGGGRGVEVVLDQLV